MAQVKSHDRPNVKGWLHVEAETVYVCAKCGRHLKPRDARWVGVFICPDPCNVPTYFNWHKVTVGSDPASVPASD